MKNPPKTLPMGKYFKTSLGDSTILMSSIIITNKNKTAMAPTQIIKKSNAKNSHSNKNKIPEADMKLRTKNNTE